MNIKQIQTELKKRKLYDGVVDGLSGRNTMKGIDTALASIPGSDNWSDARKQVAFEQLVYKEMGYDSGKIDGLVGPQTNYNRDLYEGKSDAVAAPASAPSNKLGVIKPKIGAQHLKYPTQNGVTSFYGAPGANQVTLELPFPMRLAWEPTTEVHRYSCNAKVKDGMTGIWGRVLADYGIDQIRKLRLDMFGGCLNVRKMRGGNAWSMHSWGIACDIDPDRNQMKQHHDSAEFNRAEYQKYFGAIYAQGAISLGLERDYDYMHFQFARLD